jgi:branched-chain amino acid transport system ATP-binding protein
MEATRAPLLELDEVSVRFGDVRVLANLNAFVRKGERIAIVGPGRAGKTTVLDSIIGRHTPQTGAIRHEGTDITQWKPIKRAELGIAKVSQQPELFDSLNVVDNLTVGRHRLMRSGFLRGMLYWVGGARGEEANHRQAVEEIIALLGLQSARNAKAGTLPLDVRKRIEIGRAIAMQAELLLIDEPMDELNADQQADVGRLIVTLNEERKMTVVVTARDVDSIAGISQRIMVLHQGRNIAEGSPEEIRASEAVKRAFAESMHAIETIQST